MARIVSILSAAVTLLLVGCAQADLHYVCKTVGTVLYVVELNSADAAEGTKLQRFQLQSGFPVLLDTTKYAALHEPSPVGSMWGDGVAYATTMQSRSMWMYMDGTTEAYWDKDTNTGASTWRFKSAPGGVVTETVMRSADCPGSLAVVPPPPTTAAPTNFRLCRRFGDVLYEVREDQTNTPDGTVLKRYNMSTGSAVLMDTTLYAALALPSPRLSMWGDGVAYASTMQTHFHWMYADPTLEAYWDTVSVSVESTGYEPMFSGKTTTLRINDVLVKTTFWTPLNPQDRGMNVWVLDASMSTVVDTKSYDLHASSAEASALAAYINGLAAGTPVVVAVLDEATFSTNEAAKLALESIGSAQIRSLEWRGAWAIIGRKGAAIGSVPESLSNVGKFVTVSYRVDTWRFHGHGAEPPAMVQLAALRSDECPNLIVPL